MNNNTYSLARGPRMLSWILQILTAVILLQTLFFKFTGAAESIYIFTKVGQEPVGRYGSGIVELIAAILLLWPGRATVGALITLGVISGAIFFHLTSLGIEIVVDRKSDNGFLFGLAVVSWISSVIILLIRRQEIPVIGKRFA